MSMQLNTMINPNGNEPISGSAVLFCGDKVGSGTALIPVKVTDNTTTTMRVEVTSATQTSKKGLVSAVIKVSVPYVSLTTDANGREVVDPKRSGYNSYHVVANLNKYCVEDASGRNGTLARDAALRQILGGLGLRMRISGPLLGGPTGYAINANGEEGAEWWQTDAGTNTLIHKGATPDSEPAETVSFGFFDAEGTLDLRNTKGIKLHEGAFARILAGLTPLGCEELDEAWLYADQVH